MADERKRRRLGPYAKLSATYYRDDAILAAGEAAEVLYTRTLAFSAETSSDGFITDLQMTHVVGMGLKALPKRIAALVDHGLLEHVDDGYVVRSWLKWNASADEIGMVRRQDRERKQRARIPDGVHDLSGRTQNGVTPDSLSETGQDKDIDKDRTADTDNRRTAPVPAPTDDPAGTLLAEHAAAYTTPPPPSALTPVRNAINTLVAQHTDPSLIRAGLAKMRERSLSARLLPELVAEVTPNRDSLNRRPPPSRNGQILDAAMQRARDAETQQKAIGQ